MHTHARAKLGPAGRFALPEAIAKGMTQKAAAAAFCVAPATPLPEPGGPDGLVPRRRARPARRSGLPPVAFVPAHLA
jgi:hypothetical protein